MDWSWRSYLHGLLSSPDLNPLRVSFEIYCKRNVVLRNRIEQGLRQIRETPGMMERVTRWTTRRVSSNARWSFRVIKIENSLCLINKDIFMWLFFIILRRTISSRSGCHKLRNTLYNGMISVSLAENCYEHSLLQMSDKCYN